MADRVLQPISPGYARAILAARPATGMNAAMENYAIAGIATFLLALAFAIAVPEARHWMLAPVIVCGMLSGVDLVAWVRGQLDTFDPRALIGIMCFHGMTLSPLLHLNLGVEGYTPYFNSQIEDWPYWFGMMSMFNAAGLVVFRFAQARAYSATKPSPIMWAIDDRRFVNVLLWAIVVSGMTTAFIILRFKGLGKETNYEAEVGDALVHTSWLLMLGDPLGLLIGMGVIRALSDKRRKKSIATTAVVLILLAVAQFLILGLRGSRSALLYVLFMVAGMCHYRLGKIKIQWVLIGGVFMLAFVYYYAFFKKVGSAGFQALQGSEARLALEARTGVTFSGILLGDLSRADMQAFMLYRMVHHGDRYRLRWGQTYWRAAMMLIPRAIWPEKPPGVEEAGTNLQYGEGTYRGEDGIKSSRVYGLAGEGMLNFGTPGILFMFAVYGIIVGWYRKKLTTMEQMDARLFFTPMVTLALILTIIADADNIVFGLLKNGTLPTIVVLLSSVRAARQSRPAQ